jgi:hypothetical protein
MRFPPGVSPPAPVTNPCLAPSLIYGTTATREIIKEQLHVEP